ncbi:MAG: hypothetical protein ACKOBD_03125, partial [Chloroflexota bacterium]
FSIITVLEDLIPSYGRYLAYGVIGLLVFALGFEWNASLYGDERRFYWKPRAKTSKPITP